MARHEKHLDQHLAHGKPGAGAGPDGTLTLPTLAYRTPTAVQGLQRGRTDVMIKGTSSGEVIFELDLEGK